MKVTCMQLGHPSLTKSSGGEGNTQMGLETAVRARGEEGEGRSRLVRFSDFPSCSSCRLLAAPCCVVHVELGQKVAASTCEWWAKRPATYGAWSLRVGDGAWLQQGRCCKVWCGGETRDGRVLWCYDGRQRWCAGEGEGGRGTEYLRLHGPIFPPLRAAPEVQPLGLANRRPVSPQQTDTGRHDKPQVLFPMWPIWKLEPPARLRASDGAKQGKNEDGPASRDRMERLLPDGPA